MPHKKKSPTGELGEVNTKHPYDNSTRTQRARIIKRLMKNFRLTTFEAREQMGIMHPGGRIMELRRQGYIIDSERVVEHDSNGVPHRVGLYLYRGKVKEVDDE